MVTARYRGLFFDSARWEDFSLRSGDSVVSTPAECGTTWTQAICAFLVRGSAGWEAPLDAISPWLDSLLRPLTESWRVSMTDEIAGLYEQRGRELAPPAVIDWVHRGGGATLAP